MKRELKALIGRLRWYRNAFFPTPEARHWQRSLAQQVKSRQALYQQLVEPGLFSILTPVWNGSPTRYLKALARSIETQNVNGAVEWVLLDNGCSRPSLLRLLKRIAQNSSVKLIRLEKNSGIIHGMRRCLEAATARYVLPVDGDDLLYPDAFRIVAAAVKQNEYPPLLYTDEDKIIRSSRFDPYLKPAWDPVLLLNSAYIAHLGVIDRKQALRLGAYTDPQTEGSPDWDLFLRFLKAGYSAVHIPEVIYSWRVHADSTAHDDATKSYVVSSQRRALESYLAAHPLKDRFQVEPSPLFSGGAHWHLRRQPAPYRRITITAPAENPDHLLTLATQSDLIAFIEPRLILTNPAWQLEAAGLFELYPDAVIVTGRIENPATPSTPGYFGQHWKQHTAKQVDPSFSVVDPAFLPTLLANGWSSAAEQAAHAGKRLIYSPFLSAITETQPDRNTTSDGSRGSSSRGMT